MRAICFVEISLHRGHGKFVLVISAPELGLVLDVLEDRSRESLLQWLEKRGSEWYAAVQYAGSDMGDAYQQAAEQKLPNARSVVDRFHIMKNLNDALTKARRAIQKDADEKTKELLKDCRWLLVKNRYTGWSLLTHFPAKNWRVRIPRRVEEPNSGSRLLARVAMHIPAPGSGTDTPRRAVWPAAGAG